MKNSMQLQRGVSMTEALVALVVLSVGMLGIASLFVETLRANRSAISRMQAVNLVNDLADRIQANRFGGSAYSLVAGALPSANGCVVTNNCTADQLAIDDLANWVPAVRAAMPADANGNPPVTIVDVTEGATPNEPTQYRIIIRWSEAGEPLPFSYSNVILLTPGTLET